MQQNKKDHRAIEKIWRHSLFNQPENSFIKQWWFWLVVLLVIGTIFFTGQTPYDYFGLTGMLLSVIWLILTIAIINRAWHHKKIGTILIVLNLTSLVIALISSLIAYHIGT